MMAQSDIPYYHTVEGRKKLRDGKKWELLLRPQINQYLCDHADRSAAMKSQLQHVTDKQKQERGADFIHTINPISNLKIRKWKYYETENPDLFLETLDPPNTSDDPWTRGWVDNVNIDIIFYMWERQDRRQIADSVVLWLNDGFRRWFDSERAMMKEQVCPDDTVARIPLVDEIPDRYIDTNCELKLEKELDKPVDELGLDEIRQVHSLD